MPLSRCPKGTRRHPKTKACVSHNKTQKSVKQMSVVQDDKKQHQQDIKALKTKLKFLQTEGKKNEALTAKINKYMKEVSECKTEKNTKILKQKINECNEKIKENMQKITKFAASFDDDVYDRLDESEVEELLEKYKIRS